MLQNLTIDDIKRETENMDDEEKHLFYESLIVDVVQAFRDEFPDIKTVYVDENLSIQSSCNV